MNEHRLKEIILRDQGVINALVNKIDKLEPGFRDRMMAIEVKFSKTMDKTP